MRYAFAFVIAALFSGAICLAQENIIGSGVYGGAGAGSPPPSYTTWDPANKGSEVSLTDGNNTMTVTSSGYYVARSIASHSTGKYYMEITWNVSEGSGDSCWGVQNASAGLNNVQYPGQDGTNNSMAYYDNSSNVTINNNSIGTAVAYAVTNTLAMAFDAGGQLVWFKNLTTASNWNNSALANPATGTGGYSFAAMSGPYYAMSCGQNNGTQWFAAFGPTYVGTVPIGFGNW